MTVDREVEGQGQNTPGGAARAADQPGDRARHQAVVAAFQRMATALSQARDDPAPLYMALASEAVKVFGATNAAVLTSQRCNRRELIISAAAGAVPTGADDLRFPVASTLVGAAYSLGEGILIADFSAVPPDDRPLADYFAAQSGIYVPLEKPDMLAIFSAAKASFSQDDLELACSFAELATAGSRISEMAQVREREVIATELHDGALQFLYASLLHLERVRRAGPAMMPELLDVAMTRVKQGLAEMRIQMIDGTSTTMTLGQNLEHIASRLGNGVKIRVTIEGDDLPAEHPWTPELRRICLEAVSNAIRHSSAETVDVSFMCNCGNVVLTIEDRGRGFDPARQAAGLGMRNMPMRAEKIGARFRVESSPGKGTKVVVELDGEAA